MVGRIKLDPVKWVAPTAQSNGAITHVAYTHCHMGKNVPPILTVAPHMHTYTRHLVKEDSTAAALLLACGVRWDRPHSLHAPFLAADPHKASYLLSANTTTRAATLHWTSCFPHKHYNKKCRHTNISGHGAAGAAVVVQRIDAHLQCRTDNSQSRITPNSTGPSTYQHRSALTEPTAHSAHVGCAA